MLRKVCLLFSLVFIAGLSAAQETEETDTSFVKVELDTLEVGESKAGYDDIKNAGGQNTVAADLANDDVKKDAWLRDIPVLEKAISPYYDFKRYLKKKFNLALGTDYIFLNQVATFSFSEKQASSGVFRFYGNWKAHFKDESNEGNLIFKIENRHNIGKGVTPRNLGYETGAALSTASYKEFGWGLTNFYWKQIIHDKIGIMAGIMDPGDWLDLYPLLNPFKFYLNEAFFNSPAMALPNQGLGVVFAANNLIPEVYVAAGIHDANGEPTQWLFNNFESFFGDHEFMYWVEAGWNPQHTRPLLDGHTIHVMYWHQDARRARREPGTFVQESWGLNLSGSMEVKKGLITFLRMGFSEGNGALMRHLVQAGASYAILKHDQLGIGFHWGAPSNREAGNQAGMELFYALQLTDRINIMPDLQLTFNPSFNDQKNLVGVFSVIRARYAM